MEVVNDVQLMLKSAVQYYGFSHEVRCEAKKVHELFFDILKGSFPEIDFQEAKSTVSFSGPPSSSTSTALRSASSSQGNRKQRLMNDVERDMNPSPRQPLRAPVIANEDSRITRSHLPVKESRLGSRDIGQQDDSPLLTHPGDLVVCKKKRKDREKPSTRSGSTGPVSPPSMGRSIRSPGSVSTPRETRTVAQQQVWSNQSGQQVNGSGSSGGPPIGWANPVKRLRTDAGKRRPSIM
ncbi:ATP-dependent helicase BRM [Bienertia sinuspersici]